MVKFDIPVSVLDLGPVRKGKTMRDAIDDMVRLAQTVEKLGYRRYWIAEHHNTSSIISSATVILMKHILERTSKIRVGSGGIMLPNHSALVVAEQFGTLAQLYPGRIDLGVGRAPGTDPATMLALRGTLSEERVQAFPNEIVDLLQYFDDRENQGYVKAPIAIGTHVPLYVLGSSLYSARLAGKLGLPYAFAAHFAPSQMDEAIALYRESFESSAYLEKPYVIVCMNVIAADTDQRARREMTTLQQFFVNVVRGTQQPLMPPVDTMDGRWTLTEERVVNGTLRYTLVGSKGSIKEQWIRFQQKYQIDELLAVTYIYDEEAQQYSYQLLKEAIDECGQVD